MGARRRKLMPQLLLELFSEEIPARMQAGAARDLERMAAERLKAAGLAYDALTSFAGPRRLTLVVEGLPAATPDREEELKGPKTSAPDQALEGFLRKTGLTREQLTERDGVFFAIIRQTGQRTADLVPAMVDQIIRAFPWPKSMRWGAGALRWVRPLHAILCILSGPAGAEVVPAVIEGIAAGDATAGHRFLAPGPIRVTGFDDYARKLAGARVVLDHDRRAGQIAADAETLAFARGLSVVPDPALLAEVAGLVEWPVVLMGAIAPEFLDLPPEVLQTSMREHQKFFSARDGSGRITHFVTVANVETEDQGATILAGNARVLAARLSDARFFWENDLRVAKAGMAEWAEGLKAVTFHNLLGSQADRVGRIAALAAQIAPMVGADAEGAGRAGRVAKLDLRSAMVGEFPELQGVMGRYYAIGQGEDARVAEAIAAHYRPAGAGDAVPNEPIAIAVALADKLDQLVGFFAVDEKPTGSGDPFALRRAALGVIRIIRENRLRLPLADVMGEAFFLFPHATNATTAPDFGLEIAEAKRASGWQAPAGSAHPPLVAAFAAGLLDFLAERLRVQLRGEGARHDVVTAVFGAAPDDDLNRLLSRADAVRGFVESEAGANLLAAHRRAVNILRIEEKRDGHAFDLGYEAHLLKLPEEAALAAALEEAGNRIRLDIEAEDFERAMEAMAGLRAPVDAFFEKVIVNDPAPELRRNRLRLLARLRAAMDAVADFSKIEA